MRRLPTRAWILPGFLVVALVYVFLIGHRPIAYMPGADHDDELFATTAMQLASGHWLGPYGPTTLIKGLGFPLFLAINYFVGLPTNLGLCLAYAAACCYLCVVVRPFLRSDSWALALFAALLFIPPLTSNETTRLDREFFYSAAVVAFTASTIALFFSADRPNVRLAPALLCGTLGAWVWLTREEGVWLLPMLVILMSSGMLSGSAQRRSVLARAGAALLVALVLIGCVAFTNRVVYGRFVVNEVTSNPFQSALVALEKASAPDWKPYVPVPRAARARIYEQSPTFRRLKPFLDPDAGVSPWEASGCAELPATCGDIAGGWFLWGFRDAAAKLGMFGSAKQAARFFGAIEAEVSRACSEHRLDCARWMVPLVPPFTRDQIKQFPGHLFEATRFALMVQPVGAGWRAVDALDGLDLQELELTSVPEHGPGRIITMHGTFTAPADAPLDLVGLGSTQLITFSFDAAGQQAPASGAPAPDSLPFTATLACLMEPCSVTLTNPQSSIDVAIQPPNPAIGTPIALGAGHLTIDRLEDSPLTLRTRAANFWARHAPALQPAYEALLAAGLVGLMVNLGEALMARRLSATVGIVAALGGAIGARVFLLALVDATSFPAINYGYLAPALPLIVTAAMLCVAGAFEILRRVGAKTAD